MKIENFDTGLKGQKGIDNIIITPEENYNNKQKVRSILKKIIQMGKSKLNDNLNEYFSDDVKVNCFHPINEFTGIKQFKEDFWLPLFESFPDLERREQLVLGGTFRDKVQVGSPLVAKASVEAKVVSQGKGKKVHILKFRRRKHSMKQQGHRQLFTEIQIDKIKA